MNAMKTLRRASARPVSPVRAPWSLAWLGALLGLGLALLVWAPARWLAWGVAQASQGQVQWLNPRGTVWQGSAQLLLSGGAGSRQPQALPGRLHWSLSPTWTGLRLGWRAGASCQVRSAGARASIHSAARPRTQTPMPSNCCSRGLRRAHAACQPLRI